MSFAVACLELPGLAATMAGYNPTSYSTTSRALVGLSGVRETGLTFAQDSNRQSFDKRSLLFIAYVG